ncbi:MAG: arsenite methyltransferase [Chloroflexota bacterium]|jgi:SAM-dependent methyltransferase|nr:arsenite methyltransferase [Chloroflexota bacterium]
MVLTSIDICKYQYSMNATAPTTPSTETIHEGVRARYAAAAISAKAGCAVDSDSYGSELYSALERAELPNAAVLASLGCGNPIAVADLHEGERVLDLGSGGGIDVLLSAKRVGPTGRAIGLDMTDEMLALAQRNAAEAGATNVEFVRGHIESIPLPAASVDVVISNCVINLAADKPAVFREIARVLKPGGRMGITDIVAQDHLSPTERAERGSYVGCIAGALSYAEFVSGLESVGLTDISLTATHAVADGMDSAIIKATKPVAGGASGAAPQIDMSRRELPLAKAASAGCGCGAGGCC